MKENKIQREISSDTKFISREGRIYKVVTTTSLVGTGEILDGQNDPTLAEFQETTGLGKQDKSTGYVAKEIKSENVQSNN